MAPNGTTPLARADAIRCEVTECAYLLVADDELTLEYRFLELDRGTLPTGRLATKLARHARPYRFRPRAPRGQDADAGLACALPGLPARAGLLRRSALARASTPATRDRRALPHRPRARGDPAGALLPLTARRPQGAGAVRRDLHRARAARRAGGLARPGRRGNVADGSAEPDRLHATGVPTARQGAQGPRRPRGSGATPAAGGDCPIEQSSGR